MDVSEGIAHLPWELLHDGESFLIAADNPVVPVRVVQQTSVPVEPQPRALRMLFMACAPESLHPLLDYEAEEAAIDSVATKESLPLLLVDEPTGNMGELERLLGRHPDGYFDVIHITGHATSNGQPPSSQRPLQGMRIPLIFVRSKTRCWDSSTCGVPLGLPDGGVR